MDATTEPKPAEKLTHRQILWVILGVTLPVFMGSIDQTVMAGALPSIGREFHDVHWLPWLVTAYLITFAAATPLHGKLSDIYGRQPVLMGALAIYITGSITCALAPNIPILILGRALNGIGGGGLTSLGMIVLGDVAAPKDRAKYYAYFAIVYTTSGAGGPALGGFLSEHFHWSAIFWLNIPLGLLAMMLATVCLRRLPRRERWHRLDFLGAVLIVAAAVAFMLALNLGGVVYPWTSAPIVGLAAAALILAVSFVARLLTAPEPLIPLPILRDRTALCAVFANTFGWGPVVGLNIFLPMYLQTVMGFNPTTAGLSLMMLMFMLNISAGLGATIIGRARRYKLVPMIGLAVSTAAILSLAWRVDSMTMLWFQGALMLLGLGFGPVAPLTTVTLQNTVPAHQFGTALGTMNFARTLFTTILVAAFGAIVVKSIGADASKLSAAADPANIAAFRVIFLASAASQAVAWLALLLMEEKPLQGGAL